MAHAHDHGHPHPPSGLSSMELRVRALESVPVEKGYVDPAALDVLSESYETKVGPHNSARVERRAAFARAAAPRPRTARRFFARTIPWGPAPEGGRPTGSQRPRRA